MLYSSHLLEEVEAVADAVAILDRGRIVRTAATDCLRDDVKQILLPLDSLAAAPRPEDLLDVRRYEDRLTVVVDGGPGLRPGTSPRGASITTSSICAWTRFLKPT